MNIKLHYIQFVFGNQVVRAYPGDILHINGHDMRLENVILTDEIGVNWKFGSPSNSHYIPPKEKRDG